MNIFNFCLCCVFLNIFVDSYVFAGCSRFVVVKFVLFFFCFEFYVDIVFVCVYDLMCVCVFFL